MRRKLSVLILCALTGLSAPAFARGPGETSHHAATNSVGSLQVNEHKDGTYIRIHGTSRPTFSVFKLTSPLRLFVDISASDVQGDSVTQRVGNGVISKVALIGVEENSQSMARLIIGFDQPAHYDVKADGKDVVVFVDGSKRHKGPQNVAQMQNQLHQKEARLDQANRRLAKAEAKYRDQLSNSESRYKSAMD